MTPPVRVALSDGSHLRIEERTDGTWGLSIGNEFGTAYAMVSRDDLVSIAEAVTAADRSGAGR